MPDLKAFAEALDRHVRPQTFPLAIRMVKEGEPLPERVRRPARDLGIQTAICQGFAIARRYGWLLAMGVEDISCPIAKAVFGFAPMLDYYEEGHACAGMYTETPEAGSVTEAMVEKFQEGEYRLLLVAPLHRTAFEPHVVLIHGTPAQVMRLVAAALWKRGGRIASSFSGRIDCSDSVIVTMHTGEPQVILPCYGDRIFGQAEEHEMAFALPAARLDEIVEGLEGTHRGGVRYPIPSFLRYTGQYPPTYEKMNELWQKKAEG
ncbi:MAG: DUF169 domain-containing protein [Anaerolineae bacterium]